MKKSNVKKKQLKILQKVEDSQRKETYYKRSNSKD